MGRLGNNMVENGENLVVSASKEAVGLHF